MGWVVTIGTCALLEKWLHSSIHVTLGLTSDRMLMALARPSSLRKGLNADKVFVYLLSSLPPIQVEQKRTIVKIIVKDGGRTFSVTIPKLGPLGEGSVKFTAALEDAIAGRKSRQ